MQSSLIFVSLALATGVVIGVAIPKISETTDLEATTAIPEPTIVAGDRNPATTVDADRIAADITELNRLLRNEVNARRALEQRLVALSDEVAAFEGNTQYFVAAEPSESVTNEVEVDASSLNNNWFNEQSLIDSGMESSQVSELKLHFEQLEMNRLYLRDQSTRENWSREKYVEELQVLAGKEDDFKEQLSESAYDSYLFAAGRPNRVAVTSVIASAQAGIAGIASGDHIIRYDNQRIYNGSDLQTATTGGNVSDTVVLEIERGGKTMQFYLARGPLGIRMNSVSVAP